MAIIVAIQCLYRCFDHGVGYPETFWRKYVLDPSYISTFLSFVRGPKENKRFKEHRRFRMHEDKRGTLVGFFADPFSFHLSKHCGG